MTNFRMSPEEISFIQLLERVTGVLALDCILDEKDERVIFVVKEGDAGKVVGKGGTTIRGIREHLQKNVDVIEFSNILEKFAKNTIIPAKTKNVEIKEAKSGQKIAVITVTSREKGRAIGKNGSNISKSRLLLKRHYKIDNVIIQAE